jgi:uncharacterized protein (DUF1015 family)
MTALIRPFPALRPVPETAADVAAPPYDVVTTEEARAAVEGRPWSFLHVSRAEIDLPRGTDPYAPEVYAKGAENLARMVNAGVLQRDEQDCYYLYQLVTSGHCQTGLVAVASVRAYEAHRIRRHERTSPDKETDRARQIDTLNAQTGPVFLTYRHSAPIDGWITAATCVEPELDIVNQQGVGHRLWIVRDGAAIRFISEHVNGLDFLYVADGHHRSAAAAKVAAWRRQQQPEEIGYESYNYFLTVLFPDTQVRILDYNRVVTDLNGLSLESFLDRVRQTFSVVPCEAPVRPRKRGEFGMYVAGSWYRLSMPADKIPAHDPVTRLDVSLLVDHLLAPILGIREPRMDPRLDFVGGSRGLTALQTLVDEGRMAAAFSMHPTTIDDLLAVADAGRLMPAKSTWFEPKLADGLVSHVLD